jgi:ribosomal protein L3
MIKGLWGKKIGMTQIFAQDKMMPVTAIDLSNWIVTNIRTQQRDGYEAVQCGFAGGMKRYGFKGGPASHGSNFKRIPGSVSFMRSQGRVIKGKRMAGHMGMSSRMMKNLTVVKVIQDTPVILVKGSIPGKAGSLVFVRKA